jgi:glycosyltransferase involved in cell wall biosynthesis
MIRIAFLIRSMGYGGAERQLATLARALDRKLFDVTVIIFYSGGHFLRELENSNVRLICLDKRGRWDVVRFLWRLTGELKRLDPDILHSYLVDPNLVALSLKPLLRSTRVVWGIRASNVELQRYGWLPRLTFRLQCFAARFVDLIIVNSEAGRAYHVARGFPASKCIVIPGGFDTEQFKPNRELRKQLRSEWGVAENETLIGRVGRLDPMKDHSTFLKAAAMVSRDRSDIRFVCVGDGPKVYAAKLRRLAVESRIADRVIWAGMRTDMPAVYNGLDIACSSSAYGEGFPNTIGEAMACGVPCVATDVGDSTLLVGDSGIIVPPNDPAALASGLMKCISGLTSEQRPNPRLRIGQNFGIGRLVRETEAALQALWEKNLTANQGHRRAAEVINE